MKKSICTVAFVCILVCITGCGANKASDNIAEIESGKETTESLLQQTEGAERIVQVETRINEPYTTDTKIVEVISNPVFGDIIAGILWGRCGLHGIAILTRKRR